MEHLSLRYRILIGYILLISIVGSMVAILLYEHRQMNIIESEAHEVQLIRYHIVAIHQNLINLSILGENVIGWVEADSTRYRALRLRTDSLRNRNRALNRELNRLVSDLDTQAQTAFGHRERKIAEAQALSVRLFTITISSAIILLFLSYLAIHREMKRNDQERKRREKLIGELQESNEANRKLIKLRRNLIQNVTHELRTPLTAISGNAELLLNDTEADSRMRHAQTIHDAAGRMVGMINSLLVYFRLDSGKETPSVKPFKLCSIAETLTTEFAPLAKNKGLDFKAEGETDEIVSGDKNRILSIGGNLLSNAIKFTQSGTITLSTDYTDGTFTLSVSDTGTGITKEQQARIFTPFERLGNAVTEDGFGKRTGQGKPLHREPALAQGGGNGNKRKETRKLYITFRLQHIGDRQ